MNADILLDAIAFAARAHRHQVRKDGVTPYVSHVVRVMTVASVVFGIKDPNALAAAVLHDTIEDTTTDYDDLAEKFGTDVADWVASLTKEMSVPEVTREERYHARLAMAPWPVVIGKLADIYDNLTDSKSLSPQQRAKSVKRSEEYLGVFRGKLPKEAEAAFKLVEERLETMKSYSPPS